jgi:hypothetical protein
MPRKITEPTPARGGSRQGAGRPPKPDNERATGRLVSLYPDDWAKAALIGGGSVSGGIREALRKYDLAAQPRKKGR